MDLWVGKKENSIAQVLPCNAQETPVVQSVSWVWGERGGGGEREWRSSRYSTNSLRLCKILFYYTSSLFVCFQVRNPIAAPGKVVNGDLLGQMS